MNTNRKCKKCLSFILTAALLMAAVLPAAATEEPPQSVTAGSFTKSEIKNTSIYFSAEDFAESFSAPDSAPIYAIKILTLPEAEGAKLMLDTADVTADTEISAAQLGSLMFKPGDEWVGTTTFTYAAKAEGTDYSDAATVTIVITEPAAGPLIVEDFNFTTQKNTPHSGQLIGHSTDQAPTNFTFQIVTAPTKGEVEVTDVHTGNFVYTPFLDQTGEDEFTYRIVYAPYESAIATVGITIEDTPAEQLFKYADLDPHWAAYSASKLVERDITVGEKIGDQYFYYPDKQLTRGDVILLITAAVGLESLPEASAEFKFADDSTIPSWLQQPAYRAAAAGIIKGVGRGSSVYLDADSPLTRIETLVMLNNTINPDAASDINLDYADVASVPEWGIQPVKNMEGYGLLKGFEDNTIRPYNLVTKAEGGELVYQLVKYLDAYPQTRSKLAGMIGYTSTPVSYNVSKGYMTAKIVEE